jgi:hypothetical protein
LALTVLLLDLMALQGRAIRQTCHTAQTGPRQLGRARVPAKHFTGNEPSPAVGRSPTGCAGEGDKRPMLG